MKASKIILICLTAILLLASVFGAFALDWGDNNLPDLPADDSGSGDIGDNDNESKALVNITERIALESYFELVDGTAYKLTSGYIDPVVIRPSTSEAQDSICVSTDGFYSEIYMNLVSGRRLSLEAGKEYYFWFWTEDPRY